MWSSFLDPLLGSIELLRFNGVFRDGCLDRWLFYSVQEARRVIDAWLNEYNTERPHGALAGVTPASYVKELKEISSKAA